MRRYLLSCEKNLFSVQKNLSEQQAPSPLDTLTIAKKASPAKKTRNFRRLVSFLQIKLNASKLSQSKLPICFPPQVSVAPKSPPNLTYSKQPCISIPNFPTFPDHPNTCQGPISLVISQLDGCTDDYIQECDNCHEVFETPHQLELHDAKNQFGCEDCSICFTSKFYADLHELEKHPETSYARDYIPDSTKLQFASGLY